MWRFLADYIGGGPKDEASCSADSRSCVPTKEGIIEEGAAFLVISEEFGMAVAGAPIT